MARPEVLVDDLVVLLGNVINGVNLANATDADGDPITRWRFLDTYGGDNSGYFQLNGIRRGENSWTTVNTNQLNTLEYVAGSGIGRETIRAQVFANGQWSPVGEFFIYSAVPNVSRPELTVTPFEVVAYDKINVENWLTASDPDGDPIVQFRFRNRKVGGGYFAIDGIKQVEGNGPNKWTTVDVEDLPRLTYVGALNQQQEIIDVQAKDPLRWSLLNTFFAQTLANQNRPMVANKFTRLPMNVSRPLEEFVRATDADGNSIKLYSILDTSNTPGSASVSVFGVEKPDKQWFSMTPEGFRNAVVNTADSNRIDHFRVRVFDGKFWSPIRTFSVQSETKPEIFTSGTQLFSGFFDVRRLNPMFAEDANGNFFHFYQVVDRTPNVGLPGRISAELLLDPTPDDSGSLSDGRIHSLTPQEMNRVLVRGGSVQRHFDEIFVRGFDGNYFSDWERIVVRSDPGWNTVGTTWNAFDPPLVNPLTGREEIYYSFAEFYRQDDRDTGEAQEIDFTPLPFFAKEAFRRQFLRLNQLVEDVDFVEVQDSFTHPIVGDSDVGAPHGVIRIHGWVAPPWDPANEPPPACAYTFAPTDHSDGQNNQEGGDIWITFFPFPTTTLCGGSNWEVDSANSTMAAREILSAVGIGGPSFGDIGLNLSRGPDPRQNNPLGYNGGVARSFGLLDIASLQVAYGADVDTNISNTMYDILGYWEGDFQFVDNIYDTGGHDTLDVSAINDDATVSLFEGDVSDIGSDVRIGITYGSLIEDVVTGGGNDEVRGNELVNVIRTGAGDDVIQGFGGNDFLFGGPGDDNYLFSLADGYNIIDEERGAGRDRITVEESNRIRLNDLAQDVAFRRIGRDLLIDFPINGDLSSGSMTIKDMRWGRSRIETLNIFGVDVDLTKVYALTSTVDTKFNIDFVSPPSVFGHNVTLA